jgi:hypothetical protein
MVCPHSPAASRASWLIRRPQACSTSPAASVHGDHSRVEPVGLLERQPGKSLRVALSESAAAEFHQALGAAAAALPEVVRSLAMTSPGPADDSEVEATLNLRSVQAMQLLTAAEAQHHLVILQPESAVRRVALPPGSLTIGRAPPSALKGWRARKCRARIAASMLTAMRSTSPTSSPPTAHSSITSGCPHGAMAARNAAADRQLW